MDAAWHVERHPVPTAEWPRTAEIVVVGGGLVGVSIALALAESGRRPIVVEAERLAARASGRNGGLLIPGGPEGYLALRDRWGAPDGRRIHALYDAGARALVEWIDGYEIDCAWRAEGALRAAATADEAVDLIAESAAMVSEGFDATWLPPGALAPWLPSWPAEAPKSTPLHGALLLPHGGAFHSGLLVTGLAKRAVDAGATVAEGSPVVAIAENRHGIEVRSANARISADAVVLATNVQVAELVPGLSGTVTPVRGQVLATEPVAAGTVRGAWSVNEGFEYMQQLPDGRIVAGGMRWTASDREVGLHEPDVNQDIQTRIEDWLGQILPGNECVVALRWAGIMAFTPDRLPLVGPVPEKDRQMVAAGFNGHGVPAAGMAAGIVRATLNGEALPDGVELLDPSRNGLPAGLR
jgi:gamma-glutamylputrescine oxidase